MLRLALLSLTTVLVCGPAAAQSSTPADIECTIEKVHRCTSKSCEVASLPYGLRFNLGSKTGCTTRSGQCGAANDLPVDSFERIKGDVIVRFRSNGMVLRINVERGNMVGADAHENDQVIAYTGMCRA